MNQELLGYLMETSELERQISGSEEPVLSYYSNQPGSNLVDKDVVVGAGQLMDISRHPRYVAFPDHIHNFMEMVYMYHGATVHVINGTTRIVLETNDLLLLKQGTSHAIEAAGHGDVAVHFLVLPEFFNHPAMFMEDGSVLRHFIMGAARGGSSAPDYMHYHLQELIPAQNLIENMIWTLVHKRRNAQSVNQATMGILIMELINHSDQADLYDTAQYEENLVLTAYKYLEEHYQTASLEALASLVKQPSYYLSRVFKKRTGKTFKEVVQTARMARAGYLLTATVKSVEEIVTESGYENSSYFHKLFKETYGCTPKHYRDQAHGDKQK